MKKNGIVKEYDGYCGTIIDEKKEEYLLLKKEITNNIELKVNDEVDFIAEEVKAIQNDVKIARFIKNSKSK